jgi:hypothetical protein
MPDPKTIIKPGQFSMEIPGQTSAEIDRDVLFLTAQANLSTIIEGYISDLEAVLRAFVSVAGAFCARRLNTTYWQAFLADMNEHLGTVVKPQDVWM